MLLTAYSVIIEFKLDLWRKTLNRFYQLFRLRPTMLACVLIDVTAHEFVNHKSSVTVIIHVQLYTYIVHCIIKAS